MAGGKAGEGRETVEFREKKSSQKFGIDFPRARA